MTGVAAVSDLCSLPLTGTIGILPLSVGFVNGSSEDLYLLSGLRVLRALFGFDVYGCQITSGGIYSVFFRGMPAVVIPCRRAIGGTWIRLVHDQHFMAQN